MPTQYGQQPAAPPPAYQQPYAAAAVAAPRRKKRGGLRFVAGSCVFSAWATLILSILFAVGSFMAGAAAAATAARATSGSQYFPSPSASPSPELPGSSTGLPGLGGDELGGMGNGPLGGAGPMAGIGAMMGMLQAFIPGICFASGAFTLVSGIVGFVLFLGIAQACYALLDLEEQSFVMSQTLNTIVARLGSGPQR